VLCARIALFLYLLLYMCACFENSFTITFALRCDCIAQMMRLLCACHSTKCNISASQAQCKRYASARNHNGSATTPLCSALHSALSSEFGSACNKFSLVTDYPCPLHLTSFNLISYLHLSSFYLITTTSRYHCSLFLAFNRISPPPSHTTPIHPTLSHTHLLNIAV
jgi:hypothetical protein